MTVSDAQRAIDRQDILIQVDNPDVWIVPVSMDDSKTGIYYKLKGMGFFTYFATLDRVSYPKSHQS